MKSWIIVEGATDQKLLEKLLADMRPAASFKVVAAQGRDVARPLARKQLITAHEPVVLVVDSDTTDEHRAREEQRGLEDYLAWGAATTPFKVLQFVPEIEVLFFDSPRTLQRLVGTPVDANVAAAGKLAPRKMLEMLTPGRTRSQLIDGLQDGDLQELRENPSIHDLRAFVTETSLLQA